MRKSLFFLIPLLFPLASNAEVIFFDSFESSSIHPSWGEQECKDDDLRTVTSGINNIQPIAGNRMLEVRMREAGRPNSCTGSGRIRSELIGPDVIYPGKKRYIGWSTYIPSQSKGGAHPDKPVAFSQVHWGPNTELLNLEVIDDSIYLKYYDASKGGRVRTKIANAKYNQWVNYVFEVNAKKPNSGSKGELGVYIDGSKVFSWSGYMIDNDINRDGRRKLGGYVHKGWPSANPSTMYIYQDRYTVATNLSDVLPGGTEPPKEEPTEPTEPTEPPKEEPTEPDEPCVVVVQTWAEKDGTLPVARMTGCPDYTNYDLRLRAAESDNAEPCEFEIGHWVASDGVRTIRIKTCPNEPDYNVRFR